ncbi:hypothetical protein J6590_095735 [Homalodisca vitripennis]|nr:hypothetical protein J6590_095735 [Homalodisca vitripennis]
MGGKNETENMYLKIQHEKEAVVELNNAKDLETENIDGHEAFDTKPNEGAGGNYTSKNTCNSPGSIFLENNVTRVNKEAKKTKDLENNSRLESEIVTNKEKQQDKALIQHEKEAVVELNNTKDLETENIDGHEAFDTKPNQCAGGNDTSKNTCNSPDKISKADSVDEWFQKLSQSQFLDEDDADYVEDDDYKINNHNYRYITAYHLMT